MNDDPGTEDRLRRALRARDTEVEPSPHALDRIRRSGGGGTGWPRPALLAAAVVVIAGILGVLVLTGDDGDPDVATDDSTTTTDTQPPPTDPPQTTTSAQTPAPSTTHPPPDRDPGPPAALAAEGLIVWPRDSRGFFTPEDAARSYVAEIMGDDDPQVTIERDERVAWVTVTARGEGGRLLEDTTSELTMVETDGSWEIVEVESDTMVLTSLRTTATGLRAEGLGSGFEGTGVLTTTSFCDPEAETTVFVGVSAGPVPSPFTATIGYPDCGVVIVQLSDDPAADGSTPAIASLAIRPSPPDIVVMRVAADDVLNVRSEPGAENPVVATLDPFATGVRRTPSATLAIDGTDDLWWEIVTPDGITGWANAALLSVQPVLDERYEAELRAAAISLVEQLDVDGSPTSATTTAPPPPPDASGLDVDVGGIGVYADAPTPFVRVDGADLTREATTTYDWNPFPGEPAADCDPQECELTVAEFLGFEEDDRSTADFTVGPISLADPGDRFVIGLPDAYVDRFAAVLIEVPAPDGADPAFGWRTYSVIFDFRNVDPEIIAVWRWGWTP